MISDTDLSAGLDSIERLSTLSHAEIDSLPYGFMVLDADGDVLMYNRYEAEMSHLDPSRVIGKNFFANVAPCTRVQAFEGRFRALVSGDGADVERFAFRFRFDHGAQDVMVQFARTPDRHRVFLTVSRRAIAARPPTERIEVLQTSTDTGEATGCHGEILAAPLDATLRLLARVDQGALREFATNWGAGLARAIDRHALAVHGRPVRACGPVEMQGVIDLAFASAGLGRVSVDLSARGHGALEFVIRPLAAHGGETLALVYEGLLAPIANAIDTRGDLRVTCLDLRQMYVVPWRFLADRADAVAEIVRRRDAGEAADEIAPMQGHNRA